MTMHEWVGMRAIKVARLVKASDSSKPHDMAGEDPIPLAYCTLPLGHRHAGPLILAGLAGEDVDMVEKMVLRSSQNIRCCLTFLVFLAKL